MNWEYWVDMYLDALKTPDTGDRGGDRVRELETQRDLLRGFIGRNLPAVPETGDPVRREEIRSALLQERRELLERCGQ